jgi:predicted ATP-grasp superfamily ATP-dependent carboligase
MWRRSRRLPDGPSAFILGLGTNGYGVVRALGTRGIDVVGVYRSDSEAGRFSRYCRARQFGPDVRDDQDICDALIEWGSAHKDKPALFVTSDEYAALLAKHQDSLADHFAFHWIPWSTLEEVVDKSKISEVCRRAGVIAPNTYLASRGDDLSQVLRAFRFPCIVKPIRRFDLEGGPKWRARIVDSMSLLDELFKDEPGIWDTSIVQEVIEGEDDQVFQCNLLVARSGAIAATCGVRKLYQYHPGYGHMCLGRTEENPELVTRSVKLLQILDYRGIASLEFKRQNGEYYFIEMNPRLPWYNGLFPDAGINLAYLAYLDLTMPAGVPDPAPSQRNGVHWLRFEDSLRWLLIRRRQGRAGVGRWLQSIVKARSFAWWDARDPLPCIREMAYRYSRYVRKAVARIRP